MAWHLDGRRRELVLPHCDERKRECTKHHMRERERERGNFKACTCVDARVCVHACMGEDVQNLTILSEQDLQNPHIKFFVERNPGWRNV